MRFEVTFHGPFHVATGVPELGVDRPVDPANPLPASSLKGLMRAAARDQLGLRDEVVNAVFGDDPTQEGRAPGQLKGSPWWWSDADLGEQPTVTNVARIRVDDDAGIVARGFIMFGKHVWADTASFVVEQVGDVADARIDTLVLRASAMAVLSLGGQRRRGEGWVTIAPGADEAPWAASDTAELMKLRREA